MKQAKRCSTNIINNNNNKALDGPVTTNSLLSFLGVTIYVIIAYFVAKQSNLDESVILFAAILLPVIFLNDILVSIIRGWKTHSLNYGKLAFEISKILFVVIFVYFWNLKDISVMKFCHHFFLYSDKH